MPPGKTTPNELELAILDRMASKEPILRESIRQLRVLGRKFTGVGSYTSFECEVPSADEHQRRVGLDASIVMPGVPNGLGAVLFCRGDRPECLEIFTYEEPWDGVYEGFTIAEPG